ncbi:hypothetical protein [Streptomyces sp. NPDC015131]|uniref:hypothetical protein n=1 Tax=Streptomyces sp. NPDC015131 TaxID=3364941 RepID=UPI003701AF2E
MTFPSRSHPVRSPFPGAPPLPVVATAVPEACGVPPFAPLRVGRGRHRLRRTVRRRRHAVAAGLAMTAAALAASAAGSRAPAGVDEPRAGTAPHREREPVEMVSAPVRIADAATVRLLRPGDRVDVIASPVAPVDGRADARVLARGARVAEVPRATGGEGPDGGGALVVLSVPRATATVLAGAGAASRLAVTLC